jgi:hypothetical protein
VSFADAVTREAAWLNTTTDGLPVLPTSAGGPWDVIQAYLPRSPNQQKTQIYVLRRRGATTRFSQQRRIATYSFHLSLVWPVGATTTSTNIAETEQQAFDNAIALLVGRIEGTVNDKTHGGRFLSVAEAPHGTGIDVEWGDPAQSLLDGRLIASVTYMADDPDYTA